MEFIEGETVDSLVKREGAIDLVVALEFQRADAAPFNQPLLPPLSVLDFPSRLMLIGKQILQYRHMYPLGPRMEALAQRMVQA